MFSLAVILSCHAAFPLSVRTSTLHWKIRVFFFFRTFHFWDRWWDYSRQSPTLIHICPCPSFNYQMQMEVKELLYKWEVELAVAESLWTLTDKQYSNIMHHKEVKAPGKQVSLAWRNVNGVALVSMVMLRVCVALLIDFHPCIHCFWLHQGLTMLCFWDLCVDNMTEYLCDSMTWFD